MPAAAIDREYAVGSGRVDFLVRWPLPAEAALDRVLMLHRGHRQDAAQAALQAADVDSSTISQAVAILHQFRSGMTPQPAARFKARQTATSFFSEMLPTK